VPDVAVELALGDVYQLGRFGGSDEVHFLRLKELRAKRNSPRSIDRLGRVG
jgi:hypothetical protein